MWGSAWIKYLVAHLLLPASAILDPWQCPDTLYSVTVHACRRALPPSGPSHVRHSYWHPCLPSALKKFKCCQLRECVCQHTHTSHKYTCLPFCHLMQCMSKVNNIREGSKIIFQMFLMSALNSWPRRGQTFTFRLRNDWEASVILEVLSD